MRVDGNRGTYSLLEIGRTTNTLSSPEDSHRASSSSLTEVQAQLSGGLLQIRALTSKVLQFPEIRQEKVDGLRQLVRDGSYNPRPNDIANAVLAHLLATPAAYPAEKRQKHEPQWESIMAEDLTYPAA